MDGSISLKAYAIRLNKKNKPKEVVFENEVIFDVLIECLDELVSEDGSEENGGRRAFSLSGDGYCTELGSERRISGMLKAGTSGYSSEIIGPGGELAYSRSVKDKEVIPYYFQASIPVAARMPIICIQQFSGNGLYLFFMGKFKDRLKSRLRKNDLTININPIYLSGLYLQQFYEEGVVKRITAITHRISSDSADGARQARVSSEILLSPVRKTGTIATLKEMLTRSGKRVFRREAVVENVSEIFELELDADEVQELIIDAEVGGVKRRISVGNDFGTAFDISNDVDRDENGHPEFDAINAYTTNFISQSLRSYLEK